MKVALEVEGGSFVRGRHTRPAGYASDCQKYTEASVAGWKLIRCTWAQVEGGYLWGCLDRAFENDRSANND